MNERIEQVDGAHAPQQSAPAAHLPPVRHGAGLYYQIPNWNTNFENYKSRDIDRLSHCHTPNKSHGMGLTTILSEPDGAAIYGIWALICQAASLQPRPRQGILTDTGAADGNPYTVETMALRWRRKPAEIARALTVCQRIGWLSTHGVPTEYPRSTLEVPTEYPPKGREGKGIEGKGSFSASPKKTGSARKILEKSERTKTAVGTWIEANRSLERPDPILTPQDTTAAQRILAALGGDCGRMFGVCRAYLSDSRAWGADKGHPLWAVETSIQKYTHGAADDDEGEIERMHRITARQNAKNMQESA